MFDFLMLISAIIFITTDFVYLKVIQNYFLNQVRLVQGSEPKINYLGVVLCYLFLIVGIYYFIIKPRKSVSDAFLLGVIIYGVYESTNYALLKNWSIITVIIDTLWGGVLFAFTTYAVNMIRTVFS
jgi:uncharacterized membrane protein